MNYLNETLCIEFNDNNIKNFYTGKSLERTSCAKIIKIIICFCALNNFMHMSDGVYRKYLFKFFLYTYIYIENNEVNWRI